jgi:hypothetical protein
VYDDGPALVVQVIRATPNIWKHSLGGIEEIVNIIARVEADDIAVEEPFTNGLSKGQN